jgi:hypothetical protein
MLNEILLALLRNFEEASKKFTTKYLNNKQPVLNKTSSFVNIDLKNIQLA